MRRLYDSAKEAHTPHDPPVLRRISPHDPLEYKRVIA